jgi:hypothetical protein
MGGGSLGRLNEMAAIEGFIGPERTPLFIVPRYFVSVGLG